MRAKWDALIERIGPYPDELAAAAGVSLEAAKVALRRRGYSTGPVGRPPLDPGVKRIRIDLFLPAALVEAAGGVEQIRARAENWIKRLAPEF